MLNTLTGIRTIVIGALRIASIADNSYSGDGPHDISTSLLWALAQMSTAITVACLPLLRPAFEKVVPRKFTRVNAHSSTWTGVATSRTARQDSITVTTKIHIGNAMPSPAVSARFHDGHLEPWGPAFEVAWIETAPRQHRWLSRTGPPRAVGFCCLRA